MRGKGPAGVACWDMSLPASRSGTVQLVKMRWFSGSLSRWRCARCPRHRRHHHHATCPVPTGKTDVRADVSAGGDEVGVVAGGEQGQ